MLYQEYITFVRAAVHRELEGRNTINFLLLRFDKNLIFRRWARLVSRHGCIGTGVSGVQVGTETRQPSLLYRHCSLQPLSFSSGAVSAHPHVHSSHPHLNFSQSIVLSHSCPQAALFKHDQTIHILDTACSARSVQRVPAPTFVSYSWSTIGYS